jgi:hypothetical protein
MNQLNKQKLDELEELSCPIIEWLIDNCHPHTMILIEDDHVKVLEIEAGIPV